MGSPNATIRRTQSSTAGPNRKCEPAWSWISGLHAQQSLGRLIQNGPGHGQSFVARILTLPDLLRENKGQLFADDDGLGIGPFHTVSVREKADLPVGREQVESFGHDLTDNGGKKVMPP